MNSQSNRCHCQYRLRRFYCSLLISSLNLSTPEATCSCTSFTALLPAISISSPSRIACIIVFFAVVIRSHPLSVIHSQSKPFRLSLPSACAIQASQPIESFNEQFTNPSWNICIGARTQSLGYCPCILQSVHSSSLDVTSLPYTNRLFSWFIPVTPRCPRRFAWMHFVIRLYSLLCDRHNSFRKSMLLHQYRQFLQIHSPQERIVFDFSAR